MTTSTPTPNLARARRGYVTYDWANSGYVTIVTAALGGPYLDALAKSGGAISILGLTLAPALVLPATLVLAVLAQLLILPRLGRRVDSGKPVVPALKACLLAGGAATAVLAFATSWPVVALAITAASVAFAASMVPYNALLVRIAPGAGADRLSGKAFAAGYASGGILLAVVLGVLGLAAGIPQGTVVKGAFLLVGAWWVGFGLLACRMLGEADHLPGQAAPSTKGVLSLLRDLPQLRRTVLVGLLLNDAIGSVTALSATVLTYELWTSKGLPAAAATQTLLLMILVVQVVGVPCAYLAGRLGERYGTKPVLAVMVAGWVAVLGGAWAGLHDVSQVWILAIGLAAVQGGAQTLSRSLLVQMTPADRAGSVFSLTQLAERGTAWVGPTIFGAALVVTGSYRAALASLGIVFLVALVVLLRTKVAEGRAAAASYDADAAYEARRLALPDGQAPTLLGRILYTSVLSVLRAVTALLVKLPRTRQLPKGGVVVVANHRSVADGPLIAIAGARAGRRLHLMGTAGLFTVPVFGKALIAAGMVPVKRRTPQAANSLKAMVELVNGGGAVGLFPEGKINETTDGLPGELRSGAVRLALETGAPIVAIGFSDPAQVIPLRTWKPETVGFGRRHHVSTVVGEPVRLAELLGHTPGSPVTPEVLEAGRQVVAGELRRRVLEAQGVKAVALPRPRQPEQVAETV